MFERHHKVINFFRADAVGIFPPIQDRELYPFTMDCVERFFKLFANQTFNFNADISSILIYDAKENLPKHSYAHGMLFDLPLDNVRSDPMPKPIGWIHFECGGGIDSPKITVTTSEKE